MIALLIPPLFTMGGLDPPTQPRRVCAAKSFGVSSGTR